MAVAIEKMTQSRTDPWEGNATRLLAAVNEYASETDRKSKFWLGPADDTLTRGTLWVLPEIECIAGNAHRVLPPHFPETAQERRRAGTFKARKHKVLKLKEEYGAPGPTRTDTSIRTTDFESVASTSSATGALKIKR